MAVNNPVISSLPTYVEQNKIGLLSKATLGNPTSANVNLVSGIKGATAINEINTDVKLQAGACGFTPKGASTFSQRIIDAKPIKVDMEFCDENFRTTYANHLLRTAAGQRTLPFEEQITSDIANGIAEALDALQWMGDTASGNENLSQIDGFIKILGSAAGVVKVSVASGSSVYDAVKAVVAKIPAKAIKNDTVVYVSPEDKMALVLDLVEKNLYHYAPDAEAELYFPGTRIKIVACPGLAGSKKIVAARESNMFFGTDGIGDESVFKLWFSEDADVWRLKVRFIAGVQVAFPDEVVLGTMA